MFGKGEGDGYQKQHNNDLREVSKELPTIRPVILFLAGCG